MRDTDTGFLPVGQDDRLIGTQTDCDITFGLRLGLAGVALSQIGNVSPNLGPDYIVDRFLVVVFAGVGRQSGKGWRSGHALPADQPAPPWSSCILQGGLQSLDLLPTLLLRCG